jgi:hypothetical protein
MTFHRSVVVSALLVIALGLAVGCRRRVEPARVTAHFGVLFGGQIQEREEIPLVLDRSRLSLVVRVEWAEAPETTERVHWELAQPANPKDADAGSVVAYGDARARPGEPTLDIPLAFKPGDKPGPWRVRVEVEGRPVLERPFRVVPPNQ